MYAVTVDGGTVFVNGSERRLIFAGSQLALATGLLPRGREISIEVC